MAESLKRKERGVEEEARNGSDAKRSRREKLTIRNAMRTNEELKKQFGETDFLGGADNVTDTGEEEEINGVNVKAMKTLIDKSFGDKPDTGELHLEGSHRVDHKRILDIFFDSQADIGTEVGVGDEDVVFRRGRTKEYYSYTDSMDGKRSFCRLRQKRNVAVLKKDTTPATFFAGECDDKSP